jgi:hypothetical protein
LAASAAVRDRKLHQIDVEQNTVLIFIKSEIVACVWSIHHAAIQPNPDFLLEDLLVIFNRQPSMAL